MRPDASLGLTRQLEGAFDVFVRRYAATLLHSAYLLIGDHGQAEDMLTGEDGGGERPRRRSPDSCSSVG